MTATKTELFEAWDRLINGLNWLETQPDGGKVRAAEVRDHLHGHLGRLADSLAGKRERCPRHPGSFKHNCAPCRSEQIGRADWDLPSEQPMPPVPEEVRELSARMVGERHEEGL